MLLCLLNNQSIHMPCLSSCNSALYHLVSCHLQDPRDRVYDEHTVAEDMLEFLQAFLEGTASYCVVTMSVNVLASLHR